MHPGLDYGQGPLGDCNTASSWCEENVVSLCDGVATRGRNSDGSGGSASIGWGVSIRCFDDSLGHSDPNEPLDLLDYDTDGDGNPNLSNIVVTYNHLGRCTGWELDANNNLICPQDNKVNTRFPEYHVDPYGTGVVVRKGQFLGTTGRHPYDHLHLEVYLATGYESANNAVVLNPLLMYSQGLITLHNQQDHLFRAYYPVKLDWSNRDSQEHVKEGPPGNEVIYGIFIGDLNLWSQGGNHNRGTGNDSEIIWNIQISTPTTVVEWYSDLYPINLGGVTNDTYSNDLFSYLETW